MNYNSVILAGIVLLTTVWWLVHGVRNYPGPKIVGIVVREEEEEGNGAMVEEKRDV